MFVAPPEKEVEWTDTGLEGSFRFLARVWRLVDHWDETISGEGIESPDGCTTLNAAEKALRRKTHDTIRRVTIDIEQRQQLNTAVSAMMELVNELYAFSESTVTGGPSRRSDEDVEHAGQVERKETICVDARGDRGARPHAVAVRAAHGRGAVGVARARDGADQRVVAGVRPRSREGGRGRDSGAGQRQGALAADRAGRHVGGRPRSGWRWPIPRCRAISPARRSRRWSLPMDVWSRSSWRSTPAPCATWSRWLACALVAGGTARMRLRAGRPWLVSAGDDQDGRHSADREPHRRVDVSSRSSPNGSATSSSVAASTTSCNDETGADAVLRGPRSSASPCRRAGLNQQQLASRYLVTIVVKVSFIDLKNHTASLLWSNDALTFRDEYELARRTASTEPRCVDQERSAVPIASPTDAARTIVTAIVEAF